MNQQLAITAYPRQPSGKIRGLIIHNRIGKSGFGAKIRGAKFRDQLFLGIDR